MDSKTTIRDFWKRTLQDVSWNENLAKHVNSSIEYLETRKRDLLTSVLEYLPPTHMFRTTVHFILGYDNIVYGEDVALNLNSTQFHLDRREILYYFIHELAHAGYLRYHPMPQLTEMKTIAELIDTVKLLTHLEGMGVISPLKLRNKEHGLLDPDYKTIFNEKEKLRRVRRYFTLLSALEEKRNIKLGNDDIQVLDMMSRRPSRLWYITGCYMAQRIEIDKGSVALQRLVKNGSKEFFEVYSSIEKNLT
jgi:hypothetical protein